MAWSSYLYLGVVALLAAALLVHMVKHEAQLTVANNTPSRLEVAYLVAILALGIFAIYGNFFMGKQYFAYTDVGSDTSNQYVPYYLNMLDSIREGSLGTWNFEFGLGTSFMSYQSWTLDPFNLVLIPLGLAFGNGALSQILVLVQALKILVCGLLFDRILCRYCDTGLSRILGSALYAFCGYLMLWGQHYWLGSVIVMATLLTWLIETMLLRWTVPRFAGMMAATALTVMMSTYSGFMVMLYAATYAVLRTIAMEDVRGAKSFFARFIPMAIPVVCGLLVSCITVIPYATLLLGESSRVSGSGGTSTTAKALGYLGTFVPLRWIPAILSRLLGNGLFCISSDVPESLVPSTVSFDTVNTYEFVQLGFSCGAIVLLGQFFNWARKEADRKGKVLVCVAGALCVLYCFNYFLPALSNVFVNPKYRSSFALATPICIALAVGFEKRILNRKVARVNFVVCLVLTLGVQAWSLVNSLDGKLGAAVSALCVLAFALGVFLLAIRPSSAALFSLLLVPLVASSVFDAFMVTNHRAWCTEDTFADATQTQYSQDTMDALDWIRSQDDGLYRVEKLYSDWTRLEDSLVQGYAGVSSYNSTLDSDVIDFYRQLWPNMLVGDTAYQEYVNDPDHPALLRLLGIKYLLSHDELDYSWLYDLNTIGSVHIYRVNGTDGLATVKAGSISESEIAQMDATGKEQMLSASAIVPDEVYEELSSAGTPNVVSGFQGTVTVDSNGNWVVQNPATCELTLSGSSRIAGTVTAIADNSVVCLAVPHTAGWKVTVDGVEVDTYRCNYGFVGFTVSAGEHTIEAHFEPSNVRVAAALAAVGLAGGVAACVWTRAENRTLKDGE